MSKATETSKLACERYSLDWLKNSLKGSGWMTVRALQYKHLDMTLGFDRRIRQLASESKGEILCGDGGYKLTVDATPEEIAMSLGRLRNQAGMMLKRATEIEYVFNNRGQQQDTSSR